MAAESFVQPVDGCSPRPDRCGVDPGGWRKLRQVVAPRLVPDEERALAAEHQSHAGVGRVPAVERHKRSVDAFAVQVAPNRIALRIGAGHPVDSLSLIHISEPTRLGMISYAVFCL